MADRWDLQNGAQSSPQPVLQRVMSLPVLVSLMLAALLLILMVTRFDVDIGVTWERIKNSNPWYLALALTIHYSSAISRGIRWRLLLQNVSAPDANIPGALYFGQLVVLGWFVNAIGWLRLGDAYRAYLYQDEQKTSFPLTMGTILAERSLDSALVAVLLIAASPFLLGSGDKVTLVVLGLAVSLVVGLAVLLAAMTWVKGPLLRWLPSWFGVWFERFHQGTMDSFRRVPMATFWGILGWLAEIGRMYLVVKALGFDISFAVVVFLTLANSLLTLVPTPGGVGAVEPGVGGLAVRLSSLSASAAAALVLADRSITYISVIILGAVLFLVRGAFAPPHSANSSHADTD